MSDENKYHVDSSEIDLRLRRISTSGKKVYGVPNGGAILCSCIRDAEIVLYPESADLIIDDVIDSGRTQNHYAEKYPSTPFFALFNKQTEDKLKGKFLTFPWERTHPSSDDIQTNIVRILQYIGEDPNREGLLDTPNRIVKSWKEIYAGYNQKLEDLITVFDAEKHDQMIIVKDIEFYSMCEHHNLPFFGKAHVAYVPDKQIVGLSKLARVVDMFARRMQVQERLGDQVADAIMEVLKPKGAACVIEAQHLCMCMRGVQKQNSTTITNSLRGGFLTSPEARAELFSKL
jgi:GTP cyclohydrolase I